MNYLNDELQQADAVIKEYESYLNLSANENIMSRTARHYLTTIASDRYYFQANNNGYSDFPDFVASGNEFFDSLIETTHLTLSEMFQAEYVNINPLSGIHAMLMVLLSLTKANDTIASLNPKSHGHFSTSAVIKRAGRRSTFLPSKNGDIDVGQLPAFIKNERPSMIYIDAMSYQHPFDLHTIKDIVGDNIIVVFDASHTLGLIAGDVFPNPLDSGADVMCGNTHKTFPGPHRGIILANSTNLGEIIEDNGGNLYSTVQGGTLLALAVTVAEMKIYVKKYASHTVNNARTLQAALVRQGVIHPNIPLTDNHQVHILMPDRETSIGLVKRLRKQGILVHLCYGTGEGFYVRIGTQEVTRRGMKEREMTQLASLINRIHLGVSCNAEVVEMNNNFKDIEYSFDKESEL